MRVRSHWLTVRLSLDVCQRGKGRLRSSVGKTTGSSTGERSGEKVQLVIAGAANGLTINKIRRETGLHDSTIKAILAREAEAIGERKRALAPIFARIAEAGALRIERELPTMSVNLLLPCVGIVTDKLLAITATPDSQPETKHLHLHLNANQNAERWNDLVARISQAIPLSDSSPSESDIETRGEQYVTTSEKSVNARENAIGAHEASEESGIVSE